MQAFSPLVLPFKKKGDGSQYATHETYQLACQCCNAVLGCQSPTIRNLGCPADLLIAYNTKPWVGVLQIWQHQP
jgi:hypothetical protein